MSVLHPIYSYPITATLYEYENPSNKTTVTFQSYYDSKQLYIAVDLGERVELQAVDDYGNERSIYYLTNQLGYTKPTGWFVAEPDQADAERTGNQPVGGRAVNLHNGSFVHKDTLFTILGKVLVVPVVATYRSRLYYDGPLGDDWESILESRVAVDGNANITWYPGNGREETTFEYAAGPTQPWWKTPTGLFVKARLLSGTCYLTTASGLEYKYESNHLTEITDLNGNKMTFQRDPTNRVFRIIDDLGRHYRLDYYDHGRLAEIVDFTGRRMSLEYSTGHDLSKIIDWGGYTRRFEYAGRLARIYDRNDTKVLENTYSGGLVSSQTLPFPEGEQGTYVFDWTNRASGLVEVTDPVGTPIKYEFDLALGSVLTKVRVAENPTLRGAVTGYDWSEAPDEVIERYEYDPNNYLQTRTWRETDEGGTVTKVSPYTWYFYESDVQDDETDDPRIYGNLRLVRRDHDIGDETRQHPALRESWRYTTPTTAADFTKVEKHWEQRAWREETGGAGSPEDPPNWDSWDTELDGSYATTYGYDPGGHGNLELVTYPDVSVPVSQTGITEQYTHNAYGQVLTHTDPTGYVTEFDYYATGFQEGMLKSRFVDVSGTTSDPGETYEYDALGRVIFRIDGNGQRWMTEYDDLGRVTAEITDYILPFGNLTTTYVYDGENLLQIRRPNLDDSGNVPVGEPAEIVTESTYDELSGLLLSTRRDVKSSGDPQDPVTATTRYSYDSLQRVVLTEEEFRTDEYRVSESFFDEEGRTVRTVAYLSDPADPPLDDDIVTDTYYNPDGTVARTVGKNGAFGPELETLYTYDGYGRLVQTENPDGTISKTTFDDGAGAGEVAEESSTWLIVDPDPENPPEIPPVEIRRTESLQDELGRMYEERYYHAIEPAEGYYVVKTVFDKAGRRTKQYDQYTKDTPGAPFHAWTYDEAGRVKTYTSPEGKYEESHTYDGNNNLTATTVTEADETDPNPPPPPYRINYYYDSRNQKSQKEQGPSGGPYTSTFFYYDSNGRLRRDRFSSLGIETKMTYDLAGNLVKQEEKISDSPEEEWQTTEYRTDLLGRRTAEVTTNPADNTTRVVTVYARDDFGQGRLMCRTLPQALYDCNQDMSIDDDDIDCMVALGCSAALEGERYTYEYDLRGRKTVAVDPNGSQLTYVYDVPKVGVLNRIDVGGPGVQGPTQIEYQYGDTSGGCGCADGGTPTVIITREGAVETTRVKRTYNALGQLTSDEVTVDPGTPDAHTSTVSYDYDYVSASYREIVTYDGGAALTKTYDANGRVVSLSSTLFGAAEEIAAYKYLGKDKIRERTYSFSGSEVVRNTLGYDAGGFGSKEANTWDYNVFFKQGGENPSWSETRSWGATYDAANRIAGRTIGVGHSYQFSHDLRGQLTSSTYDWPDSPASESQAKDWRQSDRTWDQAGNSSSVRQCFYRDDGGEGQCVWEDSAYTIVRNEKGWVTQIGQEIGPGVTEKHVLDRYQNFEEWNWIGPQEMTHDSNGNTLTTSVTHHREDDSTTPVENEAKVYNHDWTFTYDAWDRLLRAHDDISGDDYFWDPPRPLCGEKQFDFVYDGLGRRVRTTIQREPTHFAPCEGLQEESDFLNVYDKDGNMIQRLDLSGTEGNIHYVFGPDGRPAMMGHWSSGPQIYLADVQGNLPIAVDAESILDPGGSPQESHKGETGDCGEPNERPSKQPGDHEDDAQGNAKGLREEGLRLVDHINYAEWLLGEDGKKKSPEDAKEPCTTDNKAAGKCKFSPDGGEGEPGVTYSGAGENEDRIVDMYKKMMDKGGVEKRAVVFSKISVHFSVHRGEKEKKVAIRRRIQALIDQANRTLSRQCCLQVQGPRALYSHYTDERRKKEADLAAWDFWETEESNQRLPRGILPSQSVRGDDTYAQLQATANDPVIKKLVKRNGGSGYQIVVINKFAGGRVHGRAIVLEDTIILRGNKMARGGTGDIPDITLAHELGHLAYLTHYSSRGNLMNRSSRQAGLELTFRQCAILHNNLKR